mmetsp:Transcript_25071/g.38374  ORF Transcript_25071/g.38374 Transcript_25071/m.38374 type:complete len:285 (-) Transcript_25071:418-1272(-)
MPRRRGDLQNSVRPRKLHCRQAIRRLGLLVWNRHCRRSFAGGRRIRLSLLQLWITLQGIRPGKGIASRKTIFGSETIREYVRLFASNGTNGWGGWKYQDEEYAGDLRIDARKRGGTKSGTGSRREGGGRRKRANRTARLFIPIRPLAKKVRSQAMAHLQIRVGKARLRHDRIRLVHVGRNYVDGRNLFGPRPPHGLDILLGRFGTPLPHLDSFQSRQYRRVRGHSSLSSSTLLGSQCGYDGQRNVHGTRPWRVDHLARWTRRRRAGYGVGVRMFQIRMAVHWRK